MLCYDKKYIFPLVLDAELLNALKFLGDRNLFFLMSWLGGLPDGGWSPERLSHDKKVSTFGPYTPSSRKRKGARDWVHNLSWLRDEASIKIPELGGSEGFQAGEHIRMPRRYAPQLHGNKTFLWSKPSQFHPVYLFIWLFI